MCSSVTLVGESDRKMLKAAIKRSSGEDKVRHRVIAAEALARWKETLDGLKGEVEAVLKEEKEEKAVSAITFKVPLTFTSLTFHHLYRCDKRRWN